MREIEVKARVSNRMGVQMAARRYGIFFGKAVEQNDTVYISKNVKPEDPDYNLIRLRKSGTKVLLTMKYRASSYSKDNIEYETEVGDFDQAAAILVRLNFVVDVRINKMRQTAKFKDYEICLDEVEGLGEFIEIEKLVDDDLGSTAGNTDVAVLQADMLKIIKELGIDESARVHEGYSAMVRALTK